MRFWRKKSQDESAPVDIGPEDQDGTVAVADLESGALEGDGTALFVEDYEATPEAIIEVHEQTERAVERTRRGFFGRIGGLFERPDFDDSIWDELEEILISTDTGLPTTELVISRVRPRP